MDLTIEALGNAVRGRIELTGVFPSLIMLAVVSPKIAMRSIFVVFYVVGKFGVSFLKLFWNKGYVKVPIANQNLVETVHRFVISFFHFFHFLSCDFIY